MYMYVYSYFELVRQSQIVQSVMYSYDAVISSYTGPAERIFKLGG